MGQTSGWTTGHTKPLHQILRLQHAGNEKIQMFSLSAHCVHCYLVPEDLLKKELWKHERKGDYSSAFLSTTLSERSPIVNKPQER